MIAWFAGLVRRLWLLLACAAFALTGCTSSVAGTPTAVSAPGSEEPGSGDPDETSEESTGPTDSAEDGPEPSEDELAAGVTELFTGLNTAWAQGPESGATYQAEHNHPVLAYTAQECIDGLDVTPTYTESIVPDISTIEPDPGWTMDEGRYEDADINGHIYILDSLYTYGDPAVETPTADEIRLHVAYLDGETYFFFLCE